MKSNTLKIVVFSGAGISAESGLKTFRDHDGLWEEYNVYEVATPEAWQANPGRVLEFYNKRRQQVIDAQPNKAHILVAELERYFEVQVVTQNIDNLHEKAGSSKVLHLHGEILKAQSSIDPNLVYPIDGPELNLNQFCALGSQLRPNVVWFGEMVPNFEPAIDLIHDCDVLIIIGTSLNVYPAAGLIYETKLGCKKYLIDPSPMTMDHVKNLVHIRSKASEGMSILTERLKELAKLPIS